MKAKNTSKGNHLTPEQKALWAGLKDKRLAGRIFKIYKRNDRDEVNFFCPSENLIVEISDYSGSNEVRSERSSTDDKVHRVLHLANSCIRMDVGLVLAQIRGHFSRACAV